MHNEREICDIAEASAESGDGSTPQNPGKILINLHSGQLFQKESVARYFSVYPHPEDLVNRSPPPEKGLVLGLVLNKKSKPHAEKQEKRYIFMKKAFRRHNFHFRELSLHQARRARLTNMV